MRTLAIGFAAILFAMGSAEAASPMIGQWRGVGLQAGPDGVQSTWTVVLTIEPEKSRIQYPSLGCTGVLRETDHSAGEMTFSEEILSGPCISNGHIVVKLREGRLFWFWYKPLTGADASAVLYRADQMTDLRTPPAMRLRHPMS